MLRAGQAPAADPILYCDVNWQSVQGARRSLVGISGVRFVSWEGSFIIAKAGPALQREWPATQLAAAVGCNIVQPFELVTRPSEQVRRALSLATYDLLLLMRALPGQDFNNLPMTLRLVLQQMTWIGNRWMRQIGRICAFDYFIGNHDRFPTLGLGNINRGNLMLSENKVVAIDNTLATTLVLTNEKFIAEHTARIRILLRLLENRMDEESHKILQPAERFFSLIMGTPTNWDRIGPKFVAGVCEGLYAIAAVPAEHLDKLLAEAETAGPINTRLANFLHANLRQITTCVDRIRQQEDKRHSWR